MAGVAISATKSGNMLVGVGFLESIALRLVTRAAEVGHRSLEQRWIGAAMSVVTERTLFLLERLMGEFSVRKFRQQFIMAGETSLRIVLAFGSIAYEGGLVRSVGVVTIPARPFIDRVMRLPVGKLVLAVGVAGIAQLICGRNEDKFVGKAVSLVAGFAVFRFDRAMYYFAGGEFRFDIFVAVVAALSCLHMCGSPSEH